MCGKSGPVDFFLPRLIQNTEKSMVYPQSCLNSFLQNILILCTIVVCNIIYFDLKIERDVRTDIVFVYLLCLVFIVFIFL